MTCIVMIYICIYTRPLRIAAEASAFYPPVAAVYTDDNIYSGDENHTDATRNCGIFTVCEHPNHRRRVLLPEGGQSKCNTFACHEKKTRFQTVWSQTKIKRLQILQSKVLRIALKAPWFMRNKQLH